jgi:hypothetical protein
MRTNTNDAISQAMAPERMAIDDARQLDWLERKCEWARTMVDSGMLSLDEAIRALKEGHAKAMGRT